MWSASATYCCERVGSPSAICTINALRARSTTKRPGPAALGPFCNFCFPHAKDRYNPPSFSVTIQGLRMPAERTTTILCVSSYEKGQEFLRACKGLGCQVLLLTDEKLKNADWPRECIDEMFFMPNNIPLADLIHAVSYTARTRHIDRIVALDEFDMENVAALREHLRLPGMGLSRVRYFRDKLAMRGKAREAGVLVPEFVHVLNYDD